MTPNFVVYTDQSPGNADSVLGLASVYTDEDLTIAKGQHFIFVDTSLGNRAIVLPSAAVFGVGSATIVKTSQDQNTITLSGPGNMTATAALTWQTVGVGRIAISDGANWTIVPFNTGSSGTSGGGGTSPPAAVASLAVTPTSLTLGVVSTPTQVAVASLSVSPLSIQLDLSSSTVPPPVTTGIVHARFAHTAFGAQLSTADADWGYASPYRFTRVFSGSAALVKDRNANAKHLPYALHHETRFGSDVNPLVNTAWESFAITFAQQNNFNIEDLFLHAAVGTKNFKAPISAVLTNAGGDLVTLASIGGHQVRTPGFTVGQVITIEGNSNAEYNRPVTIIAIPNATQLQINYNGSTSGFGGDLYIPGTGQKSKDNRTAVFTWTDWKWEMNPGSTLAFNFGLWRFGQIIGTQSDGVFWDTSGYQNFVSVGSVEYTGADNAAYAVDINTLLSMYRATYPGKISCLNVGSYIQYTQNAMMGDTAGMVNLEGPSQLYDYNTFTYYDSFIKNRVVNGTLVSVQGMAFDNQTPQAGMLGLYTQYRNSGGHWFSTPDERGMMTLYTRYLMWLDANQVVSFDPANAYWSVSPLSARWYLAFEYNIGIKSGDWTKLAITGANIYTKPFTADGLATSPLTALAVLYEYTHTIWDANNKTDVLADWDATTEKQIPLPAPPTGKVWGVLMADETLNDTPVVHDPSLAGSGLEWSIKLWHVDSAILVAH